ncbi:hypothetical protein HD554DRAFT_2042635 [Boletus coccyginus]|nr:hypothetical protein HD554DRAFT_2042635 [Boletus coccyginus]
MYQCESLYAHGRIQGAAECLLEFANIVHEDVRANKFIIDWLTGFTHRSITALESVGDDASNADKWDEAIAAFSTALSLSPTVPNTTMFKWANMTLKRGSALEATSAANPFKVPRFVVYRVICDIVEWDGRLAEAVECFQQMQNELPGDAGVRDERGKWELDFKARCMKALEKNGDIAMGSASYEDAVVHYSTALNLDPLSAVLLTKQSRARDGSLQDADAQIINTHLGDQTPSPIEDGKMGGLVTELRTSSKAVDSVMMCLLDPSLSFEDGAEPSQVDGDDDLDAPFTNPLPPSYTAASSHHAPQLDKLTRVLRLFARLGQPFSALLLVPLSHNEYRRVASYRPIVVQLLRDISPRYLAQDMQTLDIVTVSRCVMYHIPSFRFTLCAGRHTYGQWDKVAQSYLS